MKLYASLKRHVSAFWSLYISLKTVAYILFYAHRTSRDLRGRRFRCAKIIKAHAHRTRKN